MDDLTEGRIKSIQFACLSVVSNALFVKWKLAPTPCHTTQSKTQLSMECSVCHTIKNKNSASTA